MYSYDLDTGSAFPGCTRYQMNEVNFVVGDDSHESIGVYRWGWAGDVLKLDVVEDPDPARVVMLTLHPCIRVLVA
jgi:hypothetical protein